MRFAIQGCYQIWAIVGNKDELAGGKVDTEWVKCLIDRFACILWKKKIRLVDHSSDLSDQSTRKLYYIHPEDCAEIEWISTHRPFSTDWREEFSERIISFHHQFDGGDWSWHKIPRWTYSTSNRVWRRRGQFEFLIEHFSVLHVFLNIERHVSQSNGENRWVFSSPPSDDYPTHVKSTISLPRCRTKVSIDFKEIHTFSHWLYSSWNGCRVRDQLTRFNSFTTSTSYVQNCLAEFLETCSVHYFERLHVRRAVWPMLQLLNVWFQRICSMLQNVRASLRCFG